MTNKEIARGLKLTSNLIELTGGNDFRARAYAGAARRVDDLDDPVAQLVEAGRLTGIPGIGAGLASDIEAFVRTGTFDTLDELLSVVPAGLMDVLRVKGLGPRKVRALWQELGVTTIDDLEEMALTGRIAGLPGFGKKSEERVLEEVRHVRTYMGRRHYAMVAGALDPLFEALRDSDGVDQVQPAGTLRRGAEDLSEVELVVSGDRDIIVDILSEFCRSAADGSVNEALYAGILPDGLPIRVYHAGPEDFPLEWWRRTGSQAHIEAFEQDYEVMEKPPTEAAIYHGVGLSFVPAELREGEGELEAAARDAIPRLIEVGDLRGTLHNHTTASDGVHSLREMAEAARAMGYEYIGICDHSRSLAIANGLSIERLRRQGEEIRALNEELAHTSGPTLRIFHGTECDILRDGSLDFPDDVLGELDFVVASIHSGFSMTEDEATERLIRAAEHPLVDILGHLTGRLLLRREGYPVNHLAVIDACARNGVAIEINANPYRLDMGWRFIRAATAQGVPIAINPDAHSIEELRFVEWGIAAARKGWLTAEQCLNALPAVEFDRWLKHRREAGPKTRYTREDLEKSSS
jgi:DNA polymerase (family X)